MFKRIIIYAAFLLIFSLGFIAWNLHLMEIEDHYGDLQKVYFESQNGDLILNKKTSKFGTISKNWQRANVITKQNDTVDLYEFVNEDKYEVFRIEKKFSLNELTFEKIIELKNEKSIKSIVNN